jgi:hypothetical protein
METPSGVFPLPKERERGAGGMTCGDNPHFTLIFRYYADLEG